MLFQGKPILPSSGTGYPGASTGGSDTRSGRVRIEVDWGPDSRGLGAVQACYPESRGRRERDNSRCWRNCAGRKGQMSVIPKTTVGFRIKYWTEWGQNLVVCGNDPRLGSWDVRKGVFMRCQVSAHARSPPRSASSAAAAWAPLLFRNRSEPSDRVPLRRIPVASPRFLALFLHTLSEPPHHLPTAASRQGSAPVDRERHGPLRRIVRLQVRGGGRGHERGAMGRDRPARALRPGDARG